MAARILICEDSDVMRTLIRDTLAVGVYEIVEAPDGDESLEVARSARPDLIILDLMMPGQSGLDVLAAIRGDPQLATIPVIMLTAVERAFTIVPPEAFGAQRYLRKPFSPAELRSVVGELLLAPVDGSAPPSGDLSA